LRSAILSELRGSDGVQCKEHKEKILFFVISAIFAVK
jgi:hypothetical protein